MSDARLVHIEGRVDRLESDVGEIKEGVKQLLQRPTSAGYSQTMKAIAVTLGVVGAIFGFFEWRITQATGTLDLRATEARIDAASDRRDLVELRVRTAVLEERSAWMKSLRNWTAATERIN